MNLIDFNVPATGAEFALGGGAAAEQRSLLRGMEQRCMSAVGFKVPDSPIAGGGAALFDNVTFPDVARIATTSQFIPGGPNTPVQMGDTTPPDQTASANSSAQQAARIAAAKRCQDEAMKTWKPVLAPWGPLARQWRTRVAKIQQSNPVRAKMTDFVKCAMKEGVPEGEAQDFAGFTRYVDAQLSAASTDEDRTAVDSKAAHIFVSCARGTVELQERLQLEAKTEFLQEHYQEVMDLAKTAESTIQRVRSQLQS